MARRQRRREPETATIESATHDGRGIAAVEGNFKARIQADQILVVGWGHKNNRQENDYARLIEFTRVMDLSGDPFLQ